MPMPIETTFASGSTLYAVLHNPDGTVWNDLNSAWETFNASLWAQYAIALTEQGTSSYYKAAYPTVAVDALSTVVIYEQSDVAPAITDAASGIGQSQGVNVAAIAENLSVTETLQISLLGMKTGAVVTGTSSSIFTTNLADTTNNVYQGRLCLFTSGALIRQVGNIIAYSGATHAITVGGPFTATPSAGDSFIIV